MQHKLRQHQLSNLNSTQSSNFNKKVTIYTPDEEQKNNLMQSFRSTHRININTSDQEQLNNQNKFYAKDDQGKSIKSENYKSNQFRHKINKYNKGNQNFKDSNLNISNSQNYLTDSDQDNDTSKIENDQNNRKIYVKNFVNRNKHLTVNKNNSRDSSINSNEISSKNDINSVKTKHKYTRDEKDSVKYKTTYSTRMKKNDASDSSQIYEPKDIQIIKEEINSKSKTKFIKVKTPQTNNKFIDRNALFKNKTKSTTDIIKNTTELEELNSSTNFNNQESSDCETQNNYINLNEKVISYVSKDYDNNHNIKNHKLNKVDSYISDKEIDTTYHLKSNYSIAKSDQASDLGMLEQYNEIHQANKHIFNSIKKETQYKEDINNYSDDNNHESSYNSYSHSVSLDSQNEINSLFKKKERYSKNVSKNPSLIKTDSKGSQFLEDTLKSPNSKINTNRSGKCKIVYEDGSVYEGQLKNNTYHGHGIFSYASGHTYLGEWLNGYQNGTGKMLYNDKSTYNGEFLNGLKHGKGVFVWPDKIHSYYGFYCQDKKQGHGIEKYSNGDVYEGNYYQGKRNGKGLLKWASGTYYLGDWVLNKMEGKGILYWPTSGRKYDGQMKNNARHGHGIFTWFDDTKYVGAFAHDNRHGYGVLTTADGLEYSGNWERDQKHGYGICKSANKIIYKGYFWQGKEITSDRYEKMSNKTGESFYNDSGNNSKILKDDQDVSIQSIKTIKNIKNFNENIKIYDSN